MTARACPTSLTALGKRCLPEFLDLDDLRFVQRHVYKNDFFAATALYEANGRKVILKVQRQAPFLLIPLSWVGRILARREEAMLRRLSDVAGAPRLIDRWGPTGLIREYIEGCTLSQCACLPDDFHERLRDLIGEVHRRDMAYVDLEKRDNVLIGADGKPYLIDFQIAWYWPKRYGGDLWPLRLVRKWLQAGDRYHLLKLQRRTRPDQLTPEQLAATYRKPWFVRLHTRATRPLTLTRRWILNRVDPRRGRGERGRMPEPNMGVAKQCP